MITITPPPLKLNRHDRVWSPLHDYVPDDSQKLTESTWLSEFGERGDYNSAFVWHEEKSLVRLAARFWGRPHAYSEGYPFKELKDQSSVHGKIYVEVLGDQPVRMSEGQIAWHVPGDTQDSLVSAYHSKWNLKMFTTADPSEWLSSLSCFTDSGSIITDSVRGYIVVIPGYRPERLKVTLPHVTVNNNEWPLHPIQFEYRRGGIGVGSL